MNIPIDTCDNGDTAFAIRTGYDAKVYPANLGLGGITRRPRCAWCINCADGAAACVTMRYHKECWSNFLGTGSSKVLATAVMGIWEA